jgi:hypothetical protein
MSSTRTQKDARAKSEDVRGSAVPISFYLRQQEKQILEQLSRKKYYSAVLTFKKKRNKNSELESSAMRREAVWGRLIQLDVRCPSGLYDTYSVHKDTLSQNIDHLNLEVSTRHWESGMSLLSRYRNEHGVHRCHIIWRTNHESSGQAPARGVGQIGAINHLALKTPAC